MIAALRRLIDDGMIKRFGIVVRHRELGYRANAMVVWDVPDERVGEAGRTLAALPFVTLCYRRPRRPPDWPYNLFCMIHGRDRATVAGQIERATRSCRPRRTCRARCCSAAGASSSAARATRDRQRRSADGRRSTAG